MLRAILKRVVLLQKSALARAALSSVMQGKWCACMKNIHDRVSRFQKAGRRSTPTFATLSILALLWTAQAWGENYPLSNIDFVSVNHQTNIILHTGSIVPVQKVLVSDSKLVLDIDQIEATDTIRTNFTSAGNISNVILQPINEHKIRLIIRGSELGKPSLAFYSANSGAYSVTALNEPEPAETDIPFKTISESNANAESTPSAALSAASSSSTAESPNNRLSAPRRDTDLFTESTNASDAAPETTLTSAAASTSPAPSRPAATTPALTTALPLPLSEAFAKSDGNSNNNMPENLMSLPWSGYLPYALLTALMLGLGLFIRNRLVQITQADPQLEDLLDANRADAGKPGKRSSFREMADAYRSKREGDKAERRIASEPERLSVPPARKADIKDVIGLHSLEQTFSDAEEGPSPPPMAKSSGGATATAPTPAVSLEQLLAALQKAQAAPSLPSGSGKPPSSTKQKPPIVNPYAPPQVSTPKKSRTSGAQGTLPPAERPAPPPKETIIPVNQALAARKDNPNSPSISAFIPPSAQPAGKGSAMKPDAAVRSRPADRQGPLPGNPEVLNFLRNVADLMEKDGKTDIAHNIHKKLNSQSLGLVR